MNPMPEFPRRARPLLFAVLAALAILAQPSVARAAEPAESACVPQPRPPGSTRSFAVAAARTAPAVVSVFVIRPSRLDTLEMSGSELTPPLSDAAPQARDAAPLERSFASGFILSADGEVITSAHAVFDAREVWVAAADGRRWLAQVTGFDRSADVALLKIAASGLPTAPVKASRRICPGEWVAALGAPFGFDHTLTAGVVSAYPRFLPGGNALPLIQTDTALNPGSSGGPLFTSDGDVVGMNSMIYSDSGIFMGVSFALPIDEVLRIAARIRSGGAPRGEIGITTQSVTPQLARAFGLAEARGALVVKVQPTSAAETAGIRSGDVIVAAGPRRFASRGDLEELLSAARPGEWLALQVWRGSGMATGKVQVKPAQQAQARPASAGQVPPEVRLGLSLSPASTTARMPAGVYVDTATGSSLLAGIETGDRITAVNGIPVANQAQFDAALETLRDRPTLALLVTRSGVAQYVPVDRYGH
jgi:serine protease Do